VLERDLIAPKRGCRSTQKAAVLATPVRVGMFSALTVDTHSVFLATPAERPPGIALAVKDLFDTAGLTTTYGSRIFADNVPVRSADAVTRLEASGYGVVGKTNLFEFAYGITSQNAHYGTVPNPLDRSRTAGGSSGGSAAAVAAGLAQVALGTDSGGSIRIPSACCGVVGFKPSHGLVSLEGCFPLAPSFDHGGPIARSTQGCADAMAALVPGWAPCHLADLADVTVGVTWTEHADEIVRASVQRAAARLPRRRSLPFPMPDLSAAGFMSEIADTHRELFAAHANEYGPDVRAKVRSCLNVSEDDARASRDARERYRQQALDALDGVDLLLTPTLPILAPAVDAPDRDIRESMTLLTHGFNALGWPAIALPCASGEPVPASVQLIGRPGDDALVLAAARLLEPGLARP
jgi:aspartyl-tRNA(Asn)/glutamyl-tRNA(Gln) amidotransferase subunit A